MVVGCSFWDLKGLWFLLTGYILTLRTVTTDSCDRLVVEWPPSTCLLSNALEQAQLLSLKHRTGTPTKKTTRDSSGKRKAQPSAQATAGRITVRSIPSSFLLMEHTEAIVYAEEEKANQKGSSYRLGS
uniref:Uncharacterized protein n=1 Tax=Photinus pyralis TaxID=7054 RepID=A0A1Y1MRX9_PHOPY